MKLRPSPDRRTFLAVALTAASYNRVHGANDRVGLGFIGYGLMAKTHVHTFGRVADFESVAVADCHSGRSRQGAAAAGGRAVSHGDFRRILDDKAVHAVVISTPDHWHALMAMMACAAGKDVYVEKPLTLFVREGEWLQAVAARTKRVVQVGTQQRSGAHYRRLRELIRGGQVGRVTSVRMTCARNISPGFGTAADGPPPPELDWDQWLGPAPDRPYNPMRALYHFRWHWDYSGGQMTNLGAHHLDIIDWVLGLDGLKQVTSVGGRYVLDGGGETPDTQDALFDCGGYTAALAVREASNEAPGEFGLEFHGTRGTVSVSRRGFRVRPDVDAPAANLVPGVRAGHPVGGPTAVERGEVARPRTEAVEDLSGNATAQYAGHARDFLECVRTRRTPVSDLVSGHRSAVACHLANLSLRLGRSLRWDWSANAVVGDAEANRMLARPYREPWDRELRALGVG